MREEQNQCQPFRNPIVSDIEQYGYLWIPGVGKLRPHTISRGWLIFSNVLNVLLILVVIGVSNLRVAMWQAKAAQASYAVANMQERMDASAASAGTQEKQLAQCMTTLVNYENRLSAVNAAVTQQAPTNQVAAQFLPILKLLKAAL
jgi:hypothetical protein